MRGEQLSKLLRACGHKDYGMDKLMLLDMSLERDPSFILKKAKEEAVEALRTNDFDWVTLAIESNFIYTANEFRPLNFGVDDLLIFTDSFRWKDVVQPDALLSVNQRVKLKDMFREIGIQYFKDISELMEHEDFSLLPFEVKHAYLLNFKEIEYVNEDIVFHLKSLLWKHLFPEMFDQKRLISIKRESLQVLRSQQINEGWVEMSDIIELFKNRYAELDLYELSTIDWSDNIQHKMHFRNPFTLGFKRIAPYLRNSI